MLPQFKPHQIVIAVKFLSLRENDVVIASDPRNCRYLLKRIQNIEFNRVFLVGDNEKESTDSRVFGWILKKDILGKVVAKL